MSVCLETIEANLHDSEWLLAHMRDVYTQLAPELLSPSPPPPLSPLSPEDEDTWESDIQDTHFIPARELYAGIHFMQCNELTAVLNMQKRVPYRHLNHFKALLQGVQMYTHTIDDIPTRVFDYFMEKGYEPETYDDVRNALQKINLRSMYPLAPAILYHISGYLPPRFTPQQQTMLYNIFRNLLANFRAVRQEQNRKNFFNYPFILRAIVRELEWVDVYRRIVRFTPSIRSLVTQQKYEAIITPFVRATITQYLKQHVYLK